MSELRYSGALPPAPDEERCARCELLPKLVHGPTRLLLDVPIRYTLHKLRRLLAGHDLAYEITADGLFAFDVDDAQLAELARRFSAVFTSVELDEIRAVLLPLDATPTPRDYLSADSLRATIVRTRAPALLEALAGDTLFTVFQPIVDAQSLALYALTCATSFRCTASTGFRSSSTTSAPASPPSTCYTRCGPTT